MKTKFFLIVVTIGLLTGYSQICARAGIVQTGSVVYTTDSRGNRVHSDLKSKKKSGDLTFSFSGWTADEITTLQEWIADMYPLIKRIYGTPAFANQVAIVKDPSGPYYNLSTNEIVLPDLSAPDRLCHEIVHAFHDDFIIWNNAYEEGMARAVEVAVMDQLQKYQYWDRFHSYYDDIWYMAQNVPAISCVNGNFFLGSPLVLARYEMAGYAWGKLLIEDSRFFIKFNASYYAAARLDSSITGDVNRLKALVGQVKPFVERRQFSAWYDAQKIFDFAPASGYQYFFRGGTTLYAYYRDTYGNETPLSGAPINWELIDYAGYSLGSGSGNLTELGWADITQITNYSGKTTVLVSVGGTQQSFTTLSGNFSGVFGTAPGGKRVLITRPKGKTVIIPVTNGSFSAPLLENVTGTFVVTYWSQNAWQVVSKTITKDASGYYVSLE